MNVRETDVTVKELIENNYITVLDGRAIGRKNKIYLLTFTRNTHCQWSCFNNITYYNDYDNIEDAIKDVPLKGVKAFYSLVGFNEWLTEWLRQVD